jgi:beta-lactamase superfamily II metal-dependent hydrolase
MKKVALVSLATIVSFLVSCHDTNSLSSNSSQVSSSSSYIPDSSLASSITDNLSGHYLYSPIEGDHLEVVALEQITAYGDSTLYKYGNYEILIDGGAPKIHDNLVQILKDKVTDGVLDLLVLTHQHYDHFGGLSSSLFKEAGIKVTEFIDNGVLTFNNDYKNIWIEDAKPYLISQGSIYKPVQALFADSSNVFHITKDITFSILDTGYYPQKNGDGEYVPRGIPNEESICSILYAPGYEVVSFADIPSYVESNILTKYSSSFKRAGDKVIYKASHHGDLKSSSKELLQYLTPNYCFVTCSILEENTSKDGVIFRQLPYTSTRERIEPYTGVDNLYWTSTTGNLTMSFDSSFSSLSFHGEGRKLNTYYYAGSVVDPVSEKDTPLENTKWASEEVDAL